MKKTRWFYHLGLLVLVLFVMQTTAIGCDDCENSYESDTSGKIFGRIKVNLKETGNGVGDGFSLVNGQGWFQNKSGDGEIHVDASVSHTGVEKTVDNDGTLVKSSYGDNDLHVNLLLSEGGGQGEIIFKTLLNNKVQQSFSQNTPELSSTSDATATNKVLTSVADHICSPEPLNLKVDSSSNGYTVTYMSPDGKFIGAETSSFGEISGTKPGQYFFSNTGQVQVSRDVLSGSDHINTLGIARYNTPNGYTGYGRTETYVGMTTGDNFKSVSGFVKSSSRQNAGNQ